MNKTIVSIWIDKDAEISLRTTDDEKNTYHKHTLKMQGYNLSVDSDVTMSQEGLDLLVENLVPYNSKNINLWTVWSHPKESKLMEDATVYHFMNKEKAKKKMLELQEKYPTDSVYIIESTVE